MKTQSTIIVILLFALITAVFAVINVDSVQVNYLFGSARIPLILVILGSVLLGGLMIGLVGIIRQYRMKRKIQQLENELGDLKIKAGVTAVPSTAANDSAVPPEADR